LGTTTSGTKDITAYSGGTGATEWYVGERVFGTGIPLGAYITSRTSGTITISKNATGSGTTILYDAPLSAELTGVGIPTVGVFKIGDYILNTNPTVTGAGGSQYIIQGWSRITNGDAHVLNTDWVEDRVLTGT
jgi:hypothetical protein